MKLIIQHTNGNLEVVLPEPDWSYEIRFNTNTEINQAMLSVINARAKFLTNKNLIDLFYDIKNIEKENIENVLLTQTKLNENNEEEEEIVFDASDLMLIFEEVSLEYISSNSTLTRPGVGTLFTFRFNNTYIPESE